MARSREGMKEKKCGCIIYDFGPPFQCDAHAKRERVLEEKQLRRVVRDQLIELGHQPTRWKEYDSQPGKWTCFCSNCGYLTIVYDTAPEAGDQVSGWGLQQPCKKSNLVPGAAPAPGEPSEGEDDHDEDE